MENMKVNKRIMDELASLSSDKLHADILSINGLSSGTSNIIRLANLEGQMHIINKVLIILREESDGK
jgi:hypothetical protein